jgi:hypothetical protein
MDGIDYYPHHSKTKYKSKLLIISLLLISLFIAYLLFTKEKVINNDGPELIFINEPKNTLPKEKKENNNEQIKVDIIQESLYEIEKLDEALQVHKKSLDK